jgi:ATP-dependent DNA helicase RecG
MHRLLQGDVGCGKTIILIFLIAVVVQSGFQVVLMAPTELLAEQHARVVSDFLGPLGVSIGLLSQGVPLTERRRRIQQVASGQVAVAIGTHALLQRSVTFQRLALVIIDEQHKFGVVQRAHLVKKAQTPDVLVLTATPIPRTLALSIYGDLRLSTVTELPPGRQPITTRWMHEAQRQELYDVIRHQLAQGRQGYVVYPLVAEGTTTDLRAATHMAKHLQAEVFPEFTVGLLHGQMKSKDKDQTMAAFVRGDVHLLVSTVIVEVGLDVPNATIMVIEHPERFGLAQLHQLRGRIGRGHHPAMCILMSDATDEAVRARLAAFVETTDGFQLAEQDLEQRGPGELLGRRQHGWLRFRIASLSRDRTLLESARQEALALVSRDPDLRGPSGAVLRDRLARLSPPSTFR